MKCIEHGIFNCIACTGIPFPPMPRGLSASPAQPLRIGIEEDETSEVDAIAGNPLSGLLKEHKFVAVHSRVMNGSQFICSARSKTMAKRIANALNNHKPNDEGV